MRVAYLKAKQTGATLILMAFIIALVATAYLLKAYDPAQLRLKQDKKTYLALNEAKQALIAYAVSNQLHPGQLPFPDRNSDATGYDGKSDCGGSPVANLTLLIGQLPIYGQTAPCSETIGLGINSVDATGNRLWYAVSPHLIRSHILSSDPIINSSILNNQWLKVLDRNGVLISDRVAAVIIAPGNPIGTQSRTALAPASEFLDTFKIGSKTYSNADYTKLDEDFILGEDSRNVSKDDLTFDKPYYFNDRLVYITIDELMAALEKRVGEVVKANLKAYATANAGNYPFAAVLGGVGSTRKYRCINDNLIGSLPLDNPADSCTYVATSSTVNSVCNFKDIASIEFRRNYADSFVDSDKACIHLGNTCTCTGAGSCSDETTNFSCDDNGACSANVAGRIRFLGAGFDTSSSPVCTLGSVSSCQSRTVTCELPSPTATTLGYSCSERITTLPAWFYANRWQDTVFYELKRVDDTDNINVGSKTARAVVITTGAPILNSLVAKATPQVRPSCNVNDYLDSGENTSLNSTYDSTNKLRSNNYNDQIFVVVP